MNSFYYAINITALQEAIRDELSELEKLIQYSVREIPLVYETTLRILGNGKRIRAILTLLICKIYSYREKNIIYGAAITEFIHNASLLHDDVIDGSKLRRGLPSAHALWGNKTSILVGDYLLTMAFEYATKCCNLHIMEILSRATKIIVSGEIKQLFLLQQLNITKDKYIALVSAKTAQLFAASCEIAVVLAKAESLKEVYEFGINLGIAFQIIDDILDYSSETIQSGKNTGNDFFEGKVTLPILIAYSNASTREKEFLHDVFKKQSRQPEDLLQITNLLCKHNALDIAMQNAREYIDRAKQKLYIFPKSNYSELLSNLLDFVINRQC